MAGQDKITSFSLFELNEHLKRVVAFNMRETIWINCEIADVGNSKGNVYLSLVERSDFKITARAEAMIWGRSLDKIIRKIGDSLWSILQVGRQVLLRVQVEFHEYFGMKLSIQDIDPTVTIGQLELKRLQTQKKLEAEHFTALNAQLPTALVWQRIAVISSSTAAGLQDFLQQINTNPHQYKFQYELFEAVVQGVNVPLEVMQQIEKIEARKADFDCIVLVRGGGARLDLMGFDDYDLCVALATCELPVLTGIGHDIDETLADLVAYQKLKTPTAVADYLIHKMLTFESTIVQYASDIKRIALERIRQESTKIDLLEEHLKHSAQQRLKRANQDLEAIAEKLHLLDPRTILARGFSAVSNAEGKLIGSVEDLKAGEEYILHLADGKVTIKMG
ncbi:exodeoxyribonuclease VII large subunit [Aureispira anguillae]|uniref:Exodeoxyribonuclease 7 large subunit n=1 Tax=Aureispira anguillae TaxID=2864201 RepID=A0A916DS97_9BACT|nr:exodeoxyribonuclease VII large subunit [Aureispira anguillae]BDS11736.1 exodeoxyribonuclease VII large subunit [Aureispira anguillae]